MTPIPGDPHKRTEQDELVTKDGKKVKLKLPPGFAPRKPEEEKTEERGAEEPPRTDPRPPVDPNWGPG
jgi:hypothetical protein